jgi:cardiolipin synthase
MARPDVARNLNLPNALTVSRAFLVPWIVVLLIGGSYAAVLWLFALAGATDAIDGYIAKRFDQQTYLGSVLDPLADKMLIDTTVIVLAAQGLLPPWLAAAVLGRDVLIVLGAVSYRVFMGSLEMNPSVLSKANTLFQVLLLVLTLLRETGLAVPQSLLSLWCGVVFTTTAASGIHYVVAWTVKAKAGGSKA